MYKVLKKEQSLVKPEASGVQHSKDNYNDLSGRTPVVGPFNYHQFIISKWCTDMEHIER